MGHTRYEKLKRIETLEKRFGDNRPLGYQLPVLGEKQELASYFLNVVLGPSSSAEFILDVKGKLEAMSLLNSREIESILLAAKASAGGTRNTLLNSLFPNT